MTWDILNVQAITGQTFSNANQLTTGQTSYLGTAGEVKLVAGATYYISGWARETTGAGVLTVGIQSRTPDGVTTTLTGYTVSTPVTNTWYRFSSTITIPSTDNNGRCYASATGGTVQYASFYCGLTPADGSLAKAITPSTGVLKASVVKTTSAGNLVKDYLIADSSYWSTSTGWTINTTDTAVTGSGNTNMSLTSAFKASGGSVNNTYAITFANSTLYEEIDPGVVHLVSAKTCVNTSFRGKLALVCTFYRKDPITGNVSIYPTYYSPSIGPTRSVSGTDYNTTAPSVQTVETLSFVMRAPLLNPTSVLTFSGTPADSSTVTIGGKTYTFKTTISTTDGHVLIGGSAANAASNLAKAITLTGTAGTNYGLNTTIHTEVTARVNTSNTSAVDIFGVDYIVASTVPTTTTGTVNATFTSTTLVVDQSTLCVTFSAYNTWGASSTAGAGYVGLPSIKPSENYCKVSATKKVADLTLSTSYQTLFTNTILSTGGYCYYDIYLIIANTSTTAVKDISIQSTIYQGKTTSGSTTFPAGVPAASTGQLNIPAVSAIAVQNVIRERIYFKGVSPGFITLKIEVKGSAATLAIKSGSSISFVDDRGAA